MIKIGTLCYVVTSCVASPRTRCAVGKIVEVVSLPYEAPDWTYLPGTYYDVRFEGSVFYCRSDKLRPISDPDADVTEQDTRRPTTPVATPTESRACTVASPDIASHAGTFTARARRAPARGAAEDPPDEKPARPSARLP